MLSLNGPLLSFLAGAITGILSGFGVGGGTVLLVYMTAFAGLDQRLAQGINLLYFLPAAALALPAHWRNGYVEKRTLLPAVGAGLLCAGGAAWLAAGMNTAVLRRCFGVFLVFIGCGQLHAGGRKRGK